MVKQNENQSQAMGQWYFQFSYACSNQSECHVAASPFKLSQCQVRAFEEDLYAVLGLTIYTKWVVLWKELFGLRQWIQVEAYDYILLPLHMTDRHPFATCRPIWITKLEGIIILGSTSFNNTGNFLGQFTHRAIHI